MPKLTADERLAQIDASRQRWQRRLTRATNALGKLERERKRLLTSASKPVPVKKPVPVAPPPKPKPPSDDVTVIPASELPILDTLPGDDLTVPAFLKREGDLAARIEEGKRIDAEARAKAQVEREEKRKAKSRGRVARLQAKARGDLTAMPLTGRAALDAIRRGSR